MEFRKNGFGDEDAAQLAEIAAVLQNVADEEISAGDAASFIISQMIAFEEELGRFSTEGEKAEHVVNAINEVANSFSVSSGDLSKALSIVSSSASAMGNSMEETLAMTTAITEETRNASRSARGLNTIMARLAQVLDENSSTGKTLIKFYDEFGVSLKDTNGNLRDSFDIFSDLSEVWNTIDPDTKIEFAIASAGQDQLNNFISLIDNFNTAIEATKTAYNSAGSAMRENEAYMSGLTAKTAQLKNTFQDLSNNVIQSEMVGGLLDLANGFLSLVNTPVGAWATQVVLLTGAGWGLVKLFQAMGIVGAITKSFQALPMALFSIQAAMGGAATATEAFGFALNASLPIIGAIVVAVTAGIAIFDAMTTSLEEQQEIVNELASDIDSLTREIEDLQEKQSSGDITEQEKERLEYLEKQLQVKQKLYELEQQELFEDTYGGGVTAEMSNLYRKIAADESFQVEINGQELEYSITGSIAELKDLKAQMDALDPESDAEEYNKLIEKYEELRDILEEDMLTLADLTFEMEVQGEAAKGLSPKQEEFVQSVESLMQILEEEGVIVSNTTDEMNSLGNEQNSLSSSLQTLSESASNAVSELSSLDDKYSTLASAVEEYNTNGALSAETLASLLELGDEYISTLSFENGQLVLNSDAFLKNSEQLRQNAIESAKSAAADQLKAIALEGVGQAANDVANTVSTSSGALDAYTDALNRLTSGAITADGALTLLSSTIKGEDGQPISLSSEQKEAIQDVLNNYQSFVNLVNSTSLSIPTISSGGSSGGGGSRTSASTVDPIEEQSKAFQEQIDILEHELKIMEQMGASEEERIAKSREIQEELKRQQQWYYAQGLDDNSEYLRDLEEQWWDYQDSIKDIYKEILESQLEDLQSQQSAYETLFDRIKEVADEQIAALEEQKEAEEEYWDEKIEALEAQNEALEDQIQKEELLDNIAKARQKQVIVYKDGRFQYISDIDEVSQAQEALEEYEREQALEEQTEALEEAKDKALAALDEQIQGWEKYKEKWSNIVDEIGSIQDKLLIEQALGIKLEGENWKERLTNLGIFSDTYIDKEGNFVDESINKNGELLRNQYLQVGEEAAILEQRLNNFDKYINEILGVQQNFINSQQSLAGQASQVWKDSLNSFNDYVQGYKDLANELNNVQVMPPSENTSGKPGTGGGHGYKPGQPNLQTTYATGTINARGGISLVGEKGPEMRVLNSGDGILPADITKNLWSWGMTTPSAMLATLAGGLDAFGQKVQIIIEKFAPSLPNVQNGPDFANYLANNFVRSVVQYQRT